MSIILATLGGIIGRMILTSLGVTLAGFNMPPEVVAKVVELATAMGPLGGSVLGLLAIAGAGAWSYWQKHRSGALTAAASKP